MEGYREMDQRLRLIHNAIVDSIFYATRLFARLPLDSGRRSRKLLFAL
jgi:hypothetical protein